MKTKLRMRLEIKEISESGTFEGLLSPYGNVDLGGDAVAAGAFTKTLQEQGNTRPLLWQHKSDTPVGSLVLEDRPEGLYCYGALLMALPEAQKAYLLIKARIVKGLSIGFETIKDAVEKGVRKLIEVKLYEGSIVTFPMNESALITSVKKRKGGRQEEVKGDFNEELAGIQLQEAGYQMRGALSCALSCVVWSDLTRDEKITATEVVIQQFSDAYTAYIPAYLDMLTEEYGEMEMWSKRRFETKAGRKISGATQEKIKSACEQIKSGHEALLALLDDEADDEDTTEEQKAATRGLQDSTAGTVATPDSEAAPKPEPVPDHSAAESLVDSIRSLIQAA